MLAVFQGFEPQAFYVACCVLCCFGQTFGQRMPMKAYLP